MTKLTHVKRDGAIISKYGDWEFINSGIETIEDAGYGFSDGETPNNVEINDTADFVGIVAHLIQQTGGHLFYKNKEVEMMDIKDTSGSRLNLNARLKYDGIEMLFNEISTTEPLNSIYLFSCIAFSFLQYFQ